MKVRVVRFTVMCAVAVLGIGGTAKATIDVMIKTSECIVFASDSRISAVQQGLITTDSYEKIVPVCSSVMVQMQGQAFVNNLTFKSFVGQLKYREKIADEDTVFVDEFNLMLARYCDSLRSSGANFGDLMISVAGIDSSGSPRLYGMRPQLDSIARERFPGEYRIGYFGNTRIAAYLTNGKSVSEISSVGITSVLDSVLSVDTTLSDDVTKSTIISAFRVRLDSLLAAAGPVLNFGLMSTQDAVDLAYVVVRATTLIDNLCFGRYGGEQSGLPTTGGDILIAVLTQSGFQWVEQPQWHTKTK